MAVYVDPAQHPFGRMIMCHMWADTEEELHEMAARLGLKRAWYQKPPKASWCHYDVSKGKRAEAVRLGAIETDEYGPVEHEARRKGDQEMLDRVAFVRSLPKNQKSKEQKK
jgi:hypothetical protein